MATVKTYRDLQAWQRSMDLAVAVHRVTQPFPSHEQFGLTIQLRRAAVSVPSNVAEGHERASTAEFMRYLSIAKGSLAEVENQLLLAVRFGYVRDDGISDAMECAAECGRLINGLNNALRRRSRD